MFENKTVVVTGGLGSIGSELVDQILIHNPKQVRIYDNRETEIFYARQKYRNNNVRVIFGDIRDKKKLMRAIKGADIIYHAAAMKHVPVCEIDPFEAVKTNVIGTQNVIECALENNIKKMILISTDKAVNPSNVMGATKLLAEKLVSSVYNYKGGCETEFGIVRFGNVLASRGSVLEIWEQYIKKNLPISITNPNMTRFFMTIPDAVRLIFEATRYAKTGETFILKMPSLRLNHLAEVFLEIKNMPNNFFNIVGLRKGEKMHEELVLLSDDSIIMENENLFLIPPFISNLTQDYNENQEFERIKSLGFNQVRTTHFSSNCPNILDKNQVKELISKVIR